MQPIMKRNFFYLRHSFRKKGKTVTRELYLGKKIPENIEELKDILLRKCLQEDVFLKLNKIKKKFKTQWKKYPKTVKKKILLDLSIDFTYNTNRIEGSTITPDETEDLLKRKISPNKPIDDVKETINHSRCFLELMNKELSLRIVKDWHKNIFSETKPDIAGKIRDYPVKVGDYRTPDWQDLKNILKEYFAWYRKNKKQHPVEFAARAHYRFEKIHPFGDGNGRIGRLLIALILKQNGFPILIIPYEKRKSYYRALSKDENYFLMYFIRRYLANFKDLMSRN